MPVVLALVSSALWGSADFLGGLLSRRRNAVAVVGASQMAGLVAVTLAAVVTGGFTGPLGWLPWAVLAGAVGAAGIMGVVSPIAALGAIVPVVLGVASGEQPSGLALAGIVLALGGAVAASG